jgi:hypothetical protein
MNESKLVIRPAQLRSMSKQVVDGAIDKGSSLRIFKILRAAGKKVKIEKGGESSRTGKKIVIEKSVSKQQQKFMGMVRAVQKGEMDAPSPEVAKAAKTMKKKDVKDFAKTKHKGLPNKKEADECWDGYKQVGMKKKGNKMVPDCVPEGKSFFAFREKVEEARQMKNPKKDSMVQKGGKTIVIDKSKEKEYLRKGWSLAESVELDEATRVSRKDFDKLKKGSMITIDYGSGIRGSTKRTFMVKSKTRSAKYNVDKVNMVDPNKPGGMKFHLYSRDGEDATLALGDMGATIKSYSIKESVELDETNAIDLARDVVKNKSAKKGLDMQTANLILKVYDKVNDANKKKMQKMNPSVLGRAVWKMVGK